MSTEYKILVTIGTDFHRFDRIIDWIDRWLEDRPECAKYTLVQHGSSRPSAHAYNVRFLTYDDLIHGMSAATAVVVHGGPASIFEARSVGRLPICVPRDPSLSEVVDGHQQAFARHLEKHGVIRLCETRDTFFKNLSDVLSYPDRGSVAVDGSRCQEAVENVARLVEHITSQRLRGRVSPFGRSR